jgi:hypothetical protein
LRRIFFVILLAFATWAFLNIQVAAANADFQEDQTFINYAQFHTGQTKKSGDRVERRTVVQVPLSSVPPKPVLQSQTIGQHYSKEEVIQLIKEFSQQYGINPDTPLCIALKESGYNQFSANKTSSARGVFQYLSGTWKATDEGKIGLSVFDADANVRAAVKYMAIHKSTKPWVTASSCPPLKIN